MSRSAQFARCVFVPRYHVENLPAGSVVYDVSSYAEPPFCELSPMWVHGGIPVPGLPGQTSDTVEGVWQGLKVIRGKTAPRFFRGPGAQAPEHQGARQRPRHAMSNPFSSLALHASLLTQNFTRTPAFQSIPYVSK